MHLKPSHIAFIRFAARAICDIALTTFIVIFLVKVLKVYSFRAAPSDIKLPYCEPSPNDYTYPEFGAVIFVRKDEVLLELPAELREFTLQAMGEKYGIKFSKDELEKFREMKTISVSMRNMKSYIDNNYRGANYVTSGLKIDSLNTELSEWIEESRKADTVVNYYFSRFNIYADQNVPYSQLKSIFNTLGSNKVKWAYLIVMSKFKEPEFNVE